MSDYARFKNIEPMYQKKIRDQETLIKALREKIRLLEECTTTLIVDNLNLTIEENTKIYDAEIVEED